MQKILFCIIFLSILGAMEWIAWMVYVASREAEDRGAQLPEEAVEAGPVPEAVVEESITPAEISPSSSKEDVDFSSFPAPSTELKDGRTERTIHMGVRQYVWEPATITAREGELVRLIIHNADVLHGLVIPDLGVNQDVPADGAVVEFVASKKGTFEFFCSIWCGEGHMEMRGSITIR